MTQSVLTFLVAHQRTGSVRRNTDERWYWQILISWFYWLDSSCYKNKNEKYFTSYKQSLETNLLKVTVQSNNVPPVSLVQNVWPASDQRLLTWTLGGVAACLASSSSHSCSRRVSFCSASPCLRVDSSSCLRPSSSCRVDSSSCRRRLSTLEVFSSSSRSSSASRRSLCRAWLSQRDTSLRRDSASYRTQAGFVFTVMMWGHFYLPTHTFL